jgi:hypothetical protein
MRLRYSRKSFLFAHWCVCRWISSRWINCWSFSTFSPNHRPCKWWFLLWMRWRQHFSGNCR